MKAFVMALVVALLGFTAPVLAGGIPTIDKDGLKGMLGSDDLIVIDVRAGRDWSSSEFMIQGASREKPSDVGKWAGNYDKGKTVVLYCA